MIQQSFAPFKIVLIFNNKLSNSFNIFDWSQTGGNRTRASKCDAGERGKVTNEMSDEGMKTETKSDKTSKNSVSAVRNTHTHTGMPKWNVNLSRGDLNVCNNNRLSPSGITQKLNGTRKWIRDRRIRSERTATATRSGEKKVRAGSANERANEKR